MEKNVFPTILALSYLKPGSLNVDKFSYKVISLFSFVWYVGQESILLSSLEPKKFVGSDQALLFVVFIEISSSGNQLINSK